MVKPTTPQQRSFEAVSKYIAEPTHFQVGGTGRLYLARNQDTNELVAIKVINFKNKSLRTTFETEVQILTEMINSVYTTKLRESFVYNNSGYIVLELLCKDLFTRTEHLSTVAEVKHIFQQVCVGVAELHQHHIAHLDLKPENILLDESDNVKICDFGGSFYWGHNAQCFSFVGSDFYLAPEIFAHKSGYEASKADIWSLGIMLFVMLTDSFPFEGETREETLGNYFLGHVCLTELEYVCPDDLSCHSLISKMLQKDPTLRPSINEVLQHEWFINNEMDVSSIM